MSVDYGGFHPRMIRHPDGESGDEPPRNPHTYNFIYYTWYDTYMEDHMEAPSLVFTP